MNKASVVRSFAMTNMLLEADLDAIENRFQIELGRNSEVGSAIEDAYFPQFPMSLRAEARRMARHYEVFYCLEKSIRQLVQDVLSDSDDPDWWDSLVPDHVKQNVRRAMKKESEAAVTSRSDNYIDYTTFGELSEIIKTNWSLFGGVIFSEVKAVEKVMGSLNSLRNPIAHCTPLAEDEVLRLELSLRDWFRLMA